MTLPDYERLDVWRSFLTAHAAMSKMLSRALEEENNLQLPWFEVLDALASAEDGALRFNELAEKVMAHPSSLSRQIDRMEEKKLVARENQLPTTAEPPCLFSHPKVMKRGKKPASPITALFGACLPTGSPKQMWWRCIVFF